MADEKDKVRDEPELPRSPVRVEPEADDRKALLRDPEQRLALRKRVTVYEYKSEKEPGVSFWIDQSWLARKLLRQRLVRDDLDETTELMNAIERCIVDVTGLTDGDGNVVEWDGDPEGGGLPGNTLDEVMAYLAVPDMPEGMTPAVPTPST